MLIPNLRMRGSDYVRKFSQGINYTCILIKEEIEADLEMARQ